MWSRLMKSVPCIRIRRLEMRAMARLKSCIAARDTVAAQRAHDRWAMLYALLHRSSPFPLAGYSE
jgi:hypothetical protein